MIHFVNDPDNARTLVRLREATERGQMPGLRPISPQEEQTLLEEMFTDPNFQEIDSVLVVRGHQPEFEQAEIFAIESETGEAGFITLAPYGADASLQYISVEGESEAAGSISTDDSVLFFQTGQPDKEVIAPQGEDKEAILRKLRQTGAFQSLERSLTQPGLEIADEDVEVALDPDANRGAIFVRPRAGALRETFTPDAHSRQEMGSLIDFEISETGEPINTRIASPPIAREPLPFPPNDVSSEDEVVQDDEDESEAEEESPVLDLFDCVQNCVQDISTPTKPITAQAYLLCTEACKVCLRIRIPAVCIPCLACLGAGGAAVVSCGIACLFDQSASGASSQLTPA